MDFVAWMDSKIKKCTWIDLGLAKIAVAAFVLMLAKLWQPLLSLDWYLYAAVFVLAIIKPLLKVLKK
jgi:hypothetical protein